MHWLAIACLFFVLGVASSMLVVAARILLLKKDHERLKAQFYALIGDYSALLEEVEAHEEKIRPDRVSLDERLR